MAIERHKAAYDASQATSFATDDLIYNPEGPGVSDADWDAHDRAIGIEDAAFDELLTRAPTTAGGVRAALAVDNGKSIAKCVNQRELDLETLVWTRGDIPISLLSERMKCPRSGNRRVTLMFTPPPQARAAE